MSATKPEPGELWSWSHDGTTLVFQILESNAKNDRHSDGIYFCVVLTHLGMVRKYRVYVGEGGCDRLVSEATKEETP